VKTEQQTRQEIIDKNLLKSGWDVSKHTQVIEEFISISIVADVSVTYGNKQFSDYVLLAQDGKPLAVVEAKKTSKDAKLGREQAKQYCLNIQKEQNVDLPFCFYTNGNEIYFWDIGNYPPRKIYSFPTREDLERLRHINKYKKSLSHEFINKNIAGRTYQISAIRSVMEVIEKKQRDFLLVMATGTGKTITAFNALINLLKSEEYLATVVVVPYQHLVTQWAEEAKEFGITFIKCFQSSKQWSTPLFEAITNYKFKEQKHIFIITTTATYISSKFQDPISKLTNLCLIVDEAHNFGSSEIQKFYLSNANFKLGLSATPDRYMDEEGTTAIFNYLGKIIYNFALAKAIEMKMLTPYSYVKNTYFKINTQVA